MKASEYIKQNGDFEITEDIEKCIPHKPKSVWDLREGDRIYFADAFNNIVGSEWEDDNRFYNLKREIGLVTLTREELDFKLESMKVYEELKRFAKDFTDEEWKDNEIEEYFIYYDYALNKIEISFNFRIKCFELYFESKENAQEAIEAVGEERVKKYYLGVEK